MKIEISIPPSPKTELVFPVLAESLKNPGRIVMFTSSVCGIVLQDAAVSSKYDIGYCSSSWEEVTSSHVWEILPKGTCVKFTQE